MKGVFRDHTVICGWNWRGQEIVRALQILSRRPIVVVNRDIRRVIAEVGNLQDVFTISGDCADPDVLFSADVPVARSVVVLADETLGESADARSVQVALAVERIQVSVYTVVELKDIRNKAHFSWTKVDDLVTDDDLSVKLFAQAIHHSTMEKGDGQGSVVLHERLLLSTYRQLIDPHGDTTQIFRVEFGWKDVADLKFDDLLLRGLELGIVPVALGGYQRHEIGERPGQDAWVSWKVEVLTNPPPGRPLRELWPEWPEDDSPLGVFVLARTREDAEKLVWSFRE